jgi:hypothetical protein
MSRRVIAIVVAVAAVVVLALGGAAWAVAGGGDDGPSATGPQAERAGRPPSRSLTAAPPTRVERGR